MKEKITIKAKEQIGFNAEKLWGEYWSTAATGLSFYGTQKFSQNSKANIRESIPYMKKAFEAVRELDHVVRRTNSWADQANTALNNQRKEFLERTIERTQHYADDLSSQRLDARQIKDAYWTKSAYWREASKLAGHAGVIADIVNIGLKASSGDYYGAAGAFVGAVAAAALAAAIIGFTGGLATPVAAAVAAGFVAGMSHATSWAFEWMFNQLDPLGINSETNKNFNDAYGFTPRIDPLVIDLNGDGVQTISIDSGVLFDFNDDQMRTGTGWLDANDGFLVYDRNGNGLIDNGGELFGVDTRKADGSLASDGFDALRDLDSNGDRIFNAEDNEFSKVKVWQDKNSDGTSQSDELSTLDELGITAIKLDSQATNIDSNGNRIAATGTVEFADGSTGTAANLDLSSNPFYREFTDTIEISEEIAAFPDMQGSGTVRDLRQAASQNIELAELLKHYSGLKTYAEQRAILDNLVSAWAKSSNYSYLFDRLEALSSGKGDEPKAAFMPSWLMQLREPNASELAQQSLLEKIAILEAFNGRDFYNFTLQENGSLHIASGSNVSSTVKPPVGKDVIVTESHLTINPEQAALLDKAYQQLLDSVYEALLPQTRLKPYLDAISLKWNDTDFELDYSKAIQQLNITSQSDAVETVLISFELQQLLVDDNLTRSLQMQRAQWINHLSKEQSVELNQQLNNPSFSRKMDGSIYIGTCGDDNSYCKYSDHKELYGGSGNDRLIADIHSKNNFLAGGSGNDILSGGYYADTYLFNLGDGKDEIQERAHYQMDNIVDASRIDTLVFGEGILPEDISIRRDVDDLLFFHSNGQDQILINSAFLCSYRAGQLVNLGMMIEQVVFADGTLWDWEYLVSQNIVSHAAIHGGDGFLYGWHGNDIMYGSYRNDWIFSFAGNDIVYAGAGNDMLEGGAGSNQLYGEAGDDYLWAGGQYSDNNLLVGGIGNDIIYGSHGSDTYLFDLGDGQDKIIEQGSHDNAVDKLIFGAGISAEDLWFEQQDHNLIVKIIGTDDQVLIENWYESQECRIDELHTADGRVLLEAEVNKMVQAMAAFAPQAGSESNLTVIQREQLDSMIAVHWQ